MNALRRFSKKRSKIVLIKERRLERENKKKENARERRKMRLQVREEKLLEKEPRKQEREEAKRRHNLNYTAPIMSS